MAALRLFAHPFSSYCQKVLIPLHENETPFSYLSLEDPDAKAELGRIWPFGKFPVLDDDGHTVAEAIAIIEHLGVRHPGPARMIPGDPALAVEVRMMDRVFDNFVSTPLQTIVGDRLRRDANRDPFGVAQARTVLDTAYRWLDDRMDGRVWAAGDAFSLADCAAAPSLFYADWAHEIGPHFGHLRAYRGRLLARPSFARCVEEARPFRSYFPLGAPDRD